MYLSSVGGGAWDEASYLCTSSRWGEGPGTRLVTCVPLLGEGRGLGRG